MLRAGNVEVISVEMTVSDLARSRSFYAEVLQFAPVAAGDENGRSPVSMRLGEETLVLVPAKNVTRPVPATMPANDRFFQHVAIVVSDMDAAYRRLVEHGVPMVSSEPQTLPRWNYDAANIRALYFRDPDGHFLELIHFPSNKGEPKWQRRDESGRLFLGIDHTAIVVRDMKASRHFYRDLLGLTIVGESLNYGGEQERLSGVPGPRVKITGLRGARGMGIELLQYLQPGTAETSGDEPLENDLLHWQINFASERPGASRDPDGHALRFTKRAPNHAAFMRDAWIRHWPRYLMEGAELGIFMIVALALTIAFEHPRSPLRQKIESGLLRQFGVGFGIGLTVTHLRYCMNSAALAFEKK